MWSGVSSQQYMQLSPPEHGISISDTQLLYRHARACQCPPESVVADLAWTLTGRFCGAAHYSQGWNCHNSPFQLVKRGAGGQESLVHIYKLEYSISCFAKTSCKHLCPLCVVLLLIPPPLHKGDRMSSICLCSFVLCGCEMCDKSSPVQQSIPMTMIIKDALKQRTPYLLYTPSISRTWLWFGNCRPFCVCSALFFFVSVSPCSHTSPGIKFNQEKGWLIGMPLSYGRPLQRLRHCTPHHCH